MSDLELPVPRAVRLAAPGDLVLLAPEECASCRELYLYRLANPRIRIENRDRFVVTSDSYRRHAHLLAVRT